MSHVLCVVIWLFFSTLNYVRVFSASLLGLLFCEEKKEMNKWSSVSCSVFQMCNRELGGICLVASVFQQRHCLWLSHRSQEVIQNLWHWLHCAVQWKTRQQQSPQGGENLQRRASWESHWWVRGLGDSDNIGIEIEEFSRWNTSIITFSYLLWFFIIQAQLPESLLWQRSESKARFHRGGQLDEELQGGHLLSRGHERSGHGRHNKNSVSQTPQTLCRQFSNVEWVHCV